MVLCVYGHLGETEKKYQIAESTSGIRKDAANMLILLALHPRATTGGGG